MQKWFYNLSLLSTLIAFSILAIGGIILIIFRVNNDTSFGFGIGALLVFESFLLLYKKYFAGK